MAADCASVGNTEGAPVRGGSLPAARAADAGTLGAADSSGMVMAAKRYAAAAYSARDVMEALCRCGTRMWSRAVGASASACVCECGHTRVCTRVRSLLRG